MLRSKLPVGFVVPAQPVARAAPPSGTDWVHEIKHDGYRIIVHRDGEGVRLFSRKAIDWTARLPAIAEGARRLKARSFTLDGEAVVVGPNGLTDSRPSSSYSKPPVVDRPMMGARLKGMPVAARICCPSPNTAISTYAEFAAPVRSANGFRVGTTKAQLFS